MILRLAGNNSDRIQNDCGKLCGWACPINAEKYNRNCKYLEGTYQTPVELNCELEAIND
jgi:hypothetical protein